MLASSQECQIRPVIQKIYGRSDGAITPFEKRGWVADPDELQNGLRHFQRKNISLIGTYHMHCVPWGHDRIRDTPTTLDTELGKGSRIIMFIVSMVVPEKPLIRAFYEGIEEKEIPIQFT